MTIIQKLKRNEIPEFLLKIAEEEGIALEQLKDKILKGEVVVPYNPIHSPKKPCAIGSGTKIKVNVNVGTSLDKQDLKLEEEKVKLAQRLGADTVMDLSVGGQLADIRRALLGISDIPFGTVPMYEIAIYGGREKGNICELDEGDFFRILEEHAKDGVDFFTIHAGITLSGVEKLRGCGRILEVVSRGGALLVEWMICNGKENPFYKHFDRVLEIAREYDVTISLGDALRPGSIFDAGDELQYHETFIVSELVKKARFAEVQVMVEGPGHVPLNKIEYEVRAIKEITHNAPLYVLGPLVIDSAAGYDHINAAIGSALAAYAGADFICYVTPAEHLSLPDLEDVRAGIVAAKIAAQAVDVARGKKGALERELEMSKARKRRDWEKQIQLALDKERALDYRNKIPPSLNDTCSMCSKYCSIKIVEEYLKGNLRA